MSDRIPLILMPGLLCDAALWRHQSDALADVAEITVADLTRDDSLDGMARRALDAAPDRFALAGLSMGGYAALAVMRLAPQRVSRLALVDTSARPDRPEQTEHRRALMARAAAGEFEAVVESHVPLYLPPGRLGEEDLVGTVRRSALGVGEPAYQRQQKAIMDRIDSRPHLPEIACPTTVICGRQDMATPLDHAEEMAAAIPGADLVVIEDCAHMSPLERPEAVTAAMRAWLGRAA